MLDNLEYHINQVLLFNKICGTEKRLEKEREAVIELYENLTLEELNEGIKALNDLDKVEVADSLMDQFYTLVYLRHSKGEDLISPNMQWFDAGEYCLMTFFQEALISLQNKDTFSYYLYLLLIINTQNKKWDMERAMNEVHKSNFSKFIDVTDMDVKSLEDLQKREAEWIYNSYKEQGKDLDCVACEVVETDGKQWLVFKNGNGKVLKVSTFISPNLKFVEVCNA